MSFRRWAAVLLAVAGSLLVVLVAVVLYVGFGGLGRHKARVETLVSEQLARPFAIDGAFEVRLLPSVKLLAEPRAAETRLGARARRWSRSGAFRPSSGSGR